MLRIRYRRESARRHSVSRFRFNERSRSSFWLDRRRDLRATSLGSEICMPRSTTPCVSHLAAWTVQRRCVSDDAGRVRLPETWRCRREFRRETCDCARAPSARRNKPPQILSGRQRRPPAWWWVRASVRERIVGRRRATALARARKSCGTALSAPGYSCIPCNSEMI